PIEDFDYGVLFAGDEEIACRFINRDAFAAVQVGIALDTTSVLLELESLINGVIRVKAKHLVAMRVYDINTATRVNGDAAAFLEALLAKARALELIIIRAEG